MISLILWLLPLGVSAALLVILATAISNAVLFPRLETPSGGPPTSRRCPQRLIQINWL